MRLVLATTVSVLFSSPLALAQAFPCFEQNLGANLSLGDDAVAQGLALGFTFPGPGGVNVTTIDVSSNGYVWLATNANPRCCNGEAAKLLIQPPSICPMWVDLNPAAAPAGGGVFFNSFPASGTTPYAPSREYATDAGAVAMTSQIESSPAAPSTIAARRSRPGTFAVVRRNA